MKRLLKSLISNEKGQSLVIIAAAMIALLGFTALVTDFGYLAFQKRHTQSTADAASLAAAWELPKGDVDTWAKDYSELHGIKHNEDDASVTVQKLNNNREVEVIISKDYPRLFGKIFSVFGDVGDYSVQAKATAGKSLIWNLDLLPLGLIKYNKVFFNDAGNRHGCLSSFDTIGSSVDQWDGGDKKVTYKKDTITITEFYNVLNALADCPTSPRITLLYGSKESMFGNFQLLALEGTGANKLKSVITYGLTTELTETVDSEEDQFSSEPGKNNNIFNAVDEALPTRLEKDGYKGYILAILPSAVGEGRSSYYYHECVLLYVDDIIIHPGNVSDKVTGKIRKAYAIHTGEFPSMYNSSDDVGVKLIK